MSETQEVQKTEETDENSVINNKFRDQHTESVDNEKTKDSDKFGFKNSTIAYLFGSIFMYFAVSIFAPISIGFAPSLFVFAFLSGLVGKNSTTAAGVSGIVGGSVLALITAGLSAVTITPILMGAVFGLIAGSGGVLSGEWVKDKIYKKVKS